MRHGIIWLLLIVIAGCSSNDKELTRLKHENARLKAKLSEYDNAIVITHGNIHTYVTAITYSSGEVKRNEPISAASALMLDRLPEGFSVEWECDPEPMSVKKSGEIQHFFDNVYSTAGMRRFSGSYTIVFPNGEKWSIPWEREFEVI